MKYVISIIFITALLPGVGPNINLGLFFVSPFRMALLAMIVYFAGRTLNLKGAGGQHIKRENGISILFFVIWFLYSIISIFWVKSIDHWIHGEYFLGIGVLCILLFSLSDLKISDFIFVLKGAWIALVVHNFLGWYEVGTHHYLFASPERLAIMNQSKDYYPVTTMLNQNDLILVLIFGMCVFSYFIVTSKQWEVKLLNGLLFCSDIGLSLFTKSRAGLLGLFIGICVLGLFLFSKKQKMVIILASLTVGGVGIFLRPNIIFYIVDKLKNVEGLNFQYAAVNSDAVRWNLIRNGFFFLKETFGFGVGTGNAEYWMSTTPIYYVREFTNMHNWWIEILTNYGLLIFALYIIYYILLFYSLYNGYRDSLDREYRQMCVTFMVFMVAFLVGSISSSSNWGKEWLWILWAFIIAFQGCKVKKFERDTKL